MRLCFSKSRPAGGQSSEHGRLTLLYGFFPFLDRLMTLPTDTLRDAQRFSSIPAAVANSSTQMTSARIAATRSAVSNAVNQMSLLMARPAKPDADSPINQRLDVDLIYAWGIKDVMDHSVRNVYWIAT